MKSILGAFVALAGLGIASAGAADIADPVYKAPVAAAPAFSWTGFYIGGSGGYGWGNTNAPSWLNSGLGYYDTGTGTGTGPGGGAPMTYNPITGGMPPLPSSNCGIPCEFTYSYTDSLAISTLDDPSGWFGGGQIGYNYQFSNNVVVGVEADIFYGSLKSDASITGNTSVEYNQTFPGAPEYAYTNIPFETSSLQIESKLEYFGTARIRIGYAFDRFLPYLTGGLAWGYNTVSQTGFASSGTTGYYTASPDGPTPPVTTATTTAISGSDSNYHVGWALGGGFEYAFADKWSLKAEYVYSDLGSKTYDLYSGGLYAGSSEYDLTLQTVKIGINYRF